ncbi:MAG: hypothetical protein MI810_19120 [Flavobacteriales bacterium]|jgi:hypothetical protein|nr:hypothetical protein [Flavobacteriales bacterium]
MKRILMIAAIALVAVACNKNQQAVKKLEGTWDITKLEFEQDLFGTPITVDLVDLGGSGSMTFDGCKLKKDEWCNVSTTLHDPIQDTTITTVSLYRVTNDGTVLETKENDTASTINIITIVELTDTDLKANWTQDGVPVDGELKKR